SSSNSGGGGEPKLTAGQHAFIVSLLGQKDLGEFIDAKIGGRQLSLLTKREADEIISETVKYKAKLLQEKAAKATGKSEPQPQPEPTEEELAEEYAKKIEEQDPGDL
ncbi:MAG: hypothetical protein QXI37_03260, partial [Thermoprotei archaeon]